MTCLWFRLSNAIRWHFEYFMSLEEGDIRYVFEIMLFWTFEKVMRDWILNEMKNKQQQKEKMYWERRSQEHHTLDRLEERGVERESPGRSSLSKANIGTVSEATCLRDRVEGSWALPSACIPPLTDLNWGRKKKDLKQSWLPAFWKKDPKHTRD